MQMRVQAALRQQFGVRALLDDAASVERHDAVGTLDRRQPVRDDERRAAAHQQVERGLLHLRSLGLGVERRRRLVEDQDRGVLVDGARDRQALALAAGQFAAVVADDRVDALGSEAMKSVRCALFRACSTRARSISAPSATLCATLSLNSTTSWLTSANWRRSAHVPLRERRAVEQDLAAARLEEARQQVDERRLPGARRADERDRFRRRSVRSMSAFAAGWSSR